MSDGPDELTHLIYTSFATDDFDEDGLEALLRQSRADNRERGVTGLLLFRDQRFLQILEGQKSVLDPLMATIADDLRHFDVYVLLEEPIAERRFASWAMGFQGWSDSDVMWPSRSVETFQSLTSAPDADETLQAIDELLDWFRDRPGVGEAVAA